MRTDQKPTTVRTADETDRDEIYRIRHEVYARELRQHPERTDERLVDALDANNLYLVAARGDDVCGFVSITPPSAGRYSIDKYFRREDVPLVFDDGLYEVRLLTVTRHRRRSGTALLLMEAALHRVEEAGGRVIVALGRVEILGMYRRVGLRPLGPRVQAGEVTYELMSASVEDLRRHAVASCAGPISRVSREVTTTGPDAIGCAHGGAFFDAIGDEFDALGRHREVINADVLDAWFDPAPAVLQTLREHLPFAARTSPPVHAEGMRRVIARTRGIPVECVMPGAGSSALIFAALRRWIRPNARVLILDPMYGEYAHVLERVIGACVERLTLDPAREYELDPRELAARVGGGVDWVVLVNPNSPTGSHVERAELRRILHDAPPSTHFWVDETYIDYVDEDQTLEADAAASTRLVVCKSMSKVYALSGMRAAYLCGPAAMLDDLAGSTPPWAVSLPAQMAACAALRSLHYYRARWNQTRHLRASLRSGLQGLGWRVYPGCANFLLCQLPADQPPAAVVEAAARTHGLFVRDVGSMGRSFDGRALRVAVKDAGSNARIVEILRATLASLVAPGEWPRGMIARVLARRGVPGVAAVRDVAPTMASR